MLNALSLYYIFGSVPSELRQLVFFVRKSSVCAIYGCFVILSFTVKFYLFYNFIFFCSNNIFYLNRTIKFMYPTRSSKVKAELCEGSSNRRNSWFNSHFHDKLWTKWHGVDFQLDFLSVQSTFLSVAFHTEYTPPSVSWPGTCKIYSYTPYLHARVLM
jgi:hypothetical protein